MDDRLKSYPYLGSEWIVDKSSNRVCYVACNFTIPNADQPYSKGWVDSDTMPGGKDAWTGLGLELGYGQKYILNNSGKRVLWSSVEVDYMALRFVYHLSGPEGKPDHKDDRCGVDFRSGVGIIGRVGYGYNSEKTNEVSRFIGPELGIGAVWVESLGLGYQIDLRILSLLW